MSIGGAVELESASAVGVFARAFRGSVRSTEVGYGKRDLRVGGVRCVVRGTRCVVRCKRGSSDGNIDFTISTEEQAARD